MSDFFQRILTERLELRPLESSDVSFVYELVNTPGWKTFIGDFQIDSREKAESYIRKILAAKNVYYWVVNLTSSESSIGLITFLKRESLDYFDLGFAFLPQYEQKGFAFEASHATLMRIDKKNKFKSIQAVTKESNKHSLKLLGRLGFELDPNNNTSKDLIYIRTKSS